VRSDGGDVMDECNVEHRNGVVELQHMYLSRRGCRKPFGGLGKWEMGKMGGGIGD
jgi:hypothetical protein